MCPHSYSGASWSTCRQRGLRPRGRASTDPWPTWPTWRTKSGCRDTSTSAPRSRRSRRCGPSCPGLRKVEKQMSPRYWTVTVVGRTVTVVAGTRPAPVHPRTVTVGLDRAKDRASPEILARPPTRVVRNATTPEQHLPMTPPYAFSGLLGVEPLAFGCLESSPAHAYLWWLLLRRRDRERTCRRDVAPRPALDGPVR